MELKKNSNHVDENERIPEPTKSASPGERPGTPKFEGGKKQKHVTG